MGFNIAYSVNMTDSGNPNVKVQLGADTPSTMQNAETLCDPIDVYCMICFSPYSQTKTEDIMANSNNCDNTSGQKREEWEVNLYKPRIKYISDQCGISRGVAQKLEIVYFDCSETIKQINSIEAINDRIEKKMSGMFDGFSSNVCRTLHLAVYCFTQTEDFANCFICSIQQLKGCYPKNYDLYNEYVINNPTPKITEHFKQMGISISLDFVIVYDSSELALISNTLNESVFIFWGLSESVPQESSSLLDTDDFEKYDDLSFWNDWADIVESWTWADWSEMLHSEAQQSSAWFMKLATAGIIAAAGFFVGGFIVGAPSFALCLISLTFAGEMSTSSVVANVSDGVLYVIDYLVYRDDNALKKAKQILSEEAFWIILGLGIFKAFNAAYKTAINDLTKITNAGGRKVLHGTKAYDFSQSYHLLKELKELKEELQPIIKTILSVGTTVLRIRAEEGAAPTDFGVEDNKGATPTDSGVEDNNRAIMSPGGIGDRKLEIK